MVRRGRQTKINNNEEDTTQKDTISTRSKI